MRLNRRRWKAQRWKSPTIARYKTSDNVHSENASKMTIMKCTGTLSPEYYFQRIWRWLMKPQLTRQSIILIGWRARTVATLAPSGQFNTDLLVKKNFVAFLCANNVYKGIHWHSSGDSFNIARGGSRRQGFSKHSHIHTLAPGAPFPHPHEYTPDDCEGAFTPHTSTQPTERAD